MPKNKRKPEQQENQGTEDGPRPSSREESIAVARGARYNPKKLNWWPLSHAISWRHRPTAANTVHTGSPLARPAYNLLYPSKRLGLTSSPMKES